MTLPAVQPLWFLWTEVAEVADHASAEGDMLRELVWPLLPNCRNFSGSCDPRIIQGTKGGVRATYGVFPSRGKGTFSGFGGGD